MKSEGSDRRTNYVNNLTGSSSSRPLNPSDGGGLSSLDGQNNAVHINGNGQVNQNTKTSSQLGKTRDGIVSVPQPLSKSADRRFSRKIYIILAGAMFVVIVLVVVTLFAMRRTKKVAQNSGDNNQTVMMNDSDNYRNGKSTSKPMYEYYKTYKDYYKNITSKDPSKWSPSDVRKALAVLKYAHGIDLWEDQDIMLILFKKAHDGGVNLQLKDLGFDAVEFINNVSRSRGRGNLL